MQADGKAIIRAAYARYAGKWFRSATYVQRVTQPGNVDTWFTTVQLPGRLRIDLAPAVAGRAMIYRDDSLYQIQLARVSHASVQPDYIFLLANDLHTEPPDRTITRLQPLFRLDRTHETVWQGRPVIVVGALAGDTVSNQFWLDKERLIVVRLIQRNGTNPRAPLDARILGYQQVAGGWMEHEVRIYLGGQLVQTRSYHDVKTGVAIEPWAFTPVPYKVPKWVRDIDAGPGGAPGLSIPH
jgi:hypothetical protein